MQEQLSQPDLAAAERKKLEATMRQREETIMPLYHQVAVTFADLHDTPWRMQDKGCITVSSEKDDEEREKSAPSFGKKK